MARPAVPHCKSCDALRKYLYTWRIDVRPRYQYSCVLKNLDINGQEIRTSPLWCPFRHNVQTGTDAKT